MKMTKTSASEIFAVDRDAWNHVCGIGLNAAVAYLVLAQGTGGDNRTTAWSAHAIEKHTGIGRDLAPRAIKTLIEAGLILQTQGGRRPRYYLAPSYAVPGCRGYQASPDESIVKAFKPAWIWLPNAFVTWDPILGDARVEVLRKLRALDALRLLVNLYGDQVWTKEGGLDWREGGIRQNYTREQVGKVGGRIIWGFRPSKGFSYEPQGPFTRYGDTFEAAFRKLLDLGYIQLIPHLVEAPGHDAEVLHTLADALQTRHPDEGAPYAAASELARHLLPAEKIEKAEQTGITRFVPALLEAPAMQVVGIANVTWPASARQAEEWAQRNEADWWFYGDLYRKALARTRNIKAGIKV